MATVAAAIGAVGALLGHAMATTVPRLVGLESWGITDASTSGSIAVALGLLLVAVAALRAVTHRIAR
jgi:uncharacterized membrane protein